jgi:hypothetical protein
MFKNSFKTTLEAAMESRRRAEVWGALGRRNKDGANWQYATLSAEVQNRKLETFTFLKTFFIFLNLFLSPVVPNPLPPFSSLYLLFYLILFPLSHM